MECRRKVQEKKPSINDITYVKEQSSDGIATQYGGEERSDCDTTSASVAIPRNPRSTILQLTVDELISKASLAIFLRETCRI